MLIGYTFFMILWYGDLYFFMVYIMIVGFGGFVMVGIGAFGLFHMYRISKNFEELGDYYWQHTQSAKKAAEMLKIALIVSVVTGGVIGVVLYAIVCRRITETFKELNSAGLYPKKEDSFLLGSAISIGVVFVLIVLAVFTLWISIWTFYSFDMEIAIAVVVSISDFLLIASITVHIFALKRFSDDILQIIEKEPSPRQMPPQIVYGQPQPVPQQATYYAPAQATASLPSEKQKDPAVDGSQNFCSQCGEKVLETNEFCPYCGNYLK